VLLQSPIESHVECRGLAHREVVRQLLLALQSKDQILNEMENQVNFKNKQAIIIIIKTSKQKEKKNPTHRSDPARIANKGAKYRRN
jgi:hypothetical protein